MRVGIFDSGIGGLTVLNCLIESYPNNEYIYFGDTLNLPYGTKSLEQLREYADKIINFLISKRVDIIVIACGTISSNLYKEIKEKYSIPIIDVLTPTVKYIKENNLNNVGVFATPMTIKSGALNSVVNNSISCPLFVPLIESGKINTKECDEAVIDYLKRLGDCEYIILGCTHYPVLEKVINKHSNSKLINMGQCVSNYINISNEGKLKVTLYFSLLSDELLKNISTIIKTPYEIKQQVLSN